MKLDNETLKKRLHYQGRQYSNGSLSRGGSGEPHMLTQAAERIEELERDSLRYKWLANAVLYCDYGDNQEPGEQIGWGICGDKRDGQQFMFGRSIDEAVDAAMGHNTQIQPPR